MTPTQHNQPPMTASRAALLIVLGLAIGTYSTLCGIGGGIFAVPLLHYLFRMPLKAAIANSLVVVAVMTSGSTLIEALHPTSGLHWDIVLALVATSVLGSQLGYRVAVRLDVRRLKMVFCVLLLAVGTEVFLTAHEREQALRLGPFTPSALQYVGVASIGLVAGFVAPLLGIGGGLVAVPGLLLGVPEIGYVGARACSTAMSALNGWQSVWLYQSQRGIHVPTAAAASCGALGGACLGIELAHRPGIATIAQLMVALTLYFVAARFAWDVRAPESARA